MRDEELEEVMRRLEAQVGVIATHKREAVREILAAPRWPSDAKRLLVEVAYSPDWEPFISGCIADCGLGPLSDIEDQLAQLEPSDVPHGPGLYLFRAVHVAAEVGDYGSIENAAYWDLTAEGFRPFPKEKPC